jgi:hypothetical protein
MALLKILGRFAYRRVISSWSAPSIFANETRFRSSQIMDRKTAPEGVKIAQPLFYGPLRNVEGMRGARRATPLRVRP